MAWSRFWTIPSRTGGMNLVPTHFHFDSQHRGVKDFGLQFRPLRTQTRPVWDCQDGLPQKDPQSTTPADRQSRPGPTDPDETRDTRHETRVFSEFRQEFCEAFGI